MTAQVRVNCMPAMPRQYPGKAGVRGTAPEPVRGPRGEKRAMENIGSERNFGEQLATICRGFLFFHCVFSYFFATRSAESLVPIGTIFSSRGSKDPQELGKFSAANTRNSGTTYDGQA